MSAQASQPAGEVKMTPPSETSIAEEMAKIPYEPLLPVEKKLIVWSLILGIALLFVLVWASHTFFSV